MSQICTYDHIVIGTGSMGAATCYYLARSGRTVLGIDQFNPPHEQGSHGGETRIIRKAYFEHPDYIPLLQRAYHNWNELENATGERLYTPTGLFYAGPKNDLMLKGVCDAAATYNISLQKGEGTTLREKWPQFHLPADHQTLFEPEAGYLRPSAAIKCYLNEAARAGAAFLHNTKVYKWEPVGEQVKVYTDKGEFYCQKLVITAGSWSAQLIPGISKHLKVTRQVLAWFDAPDRTLFQKDRFPCWMVATADLPGAYYGFPLPDHDDGPGYIKVAYHHAGEASDPDRVNRKVTPKDTDHILSFLKEYLPAALGPIAATKVCLYSYSPDEHFIIDNLPGHENKVCVAWGFSGHGFKFTSVIGEIMADLAMLGRTPLPIGFLNARRFNG